MDFNTSMFFALVTLTAMELVLGIDNIIFIALLTDKLPVNKRDKIRNIGIGLALGMRLLLLFSISWVMSLKDPVVSLASFQLSGRDLILIFGGLFLVYKSTTEIHEKIREIDHNESKGLKVKKSASSVLFQIILLDIVFSLDSVITAVGMVEEIWIMVVAMVISVVVMLISAKSISVFIGKNPTLKVLALSFLLMIGVMLVMEGSGQHVNKGYIYFAIFFSSCVEFINLRVRKKSKISKS